MLHNLLVEHRKKELILVNQIRDRLNQSTSDEDRTEVAYLPNLIPPEPVDYIFVSMEPSFKTWAKSEDQAEQRVKEGLRNFIVSWEDFIFQYSIDSYLSSSYYLTDISKAAMIVEDANECRKDIYPLWKKLLLEEISIVGKKNAKVICVGGAVSKFFDNNNMNYSLNIMHYSGGGAGAMIKRNEIPDKFPNDFQLFIKREGLTETTIIEFARNLLEQYGIPQKPTAEWILKGLQKKPTKLSESRKKLIFTYFFEFKQFLHGSQWRSDIE